MLQNVAKTPPCPPACPQSGAVERTWREDINDKKNQVQYLGPNNNLQKDEKDVEVLSKVHVYTNMYKIDDK